MQQKIAMIRIIIKLRTVNPAPIKEVGIPKPENALPDIEKQL